MKLDVKLLRYLSKDDFRVEMGSKNHEVVPTELIVNLSQMKHGNVRNILMELTKSKLVSRESNVKYDGYRLTYGGYDYLAVRTMSKRDSLFSIGNQIGVGKESDVYIVADKEGKQNVLKIHRLGRTSFRTIKNNRDYLSKRKHASWLYLSRLSAAKEFAFMTALYENGFPVPKPIDHNRHCILMELLNAHPLCQITEIANPGKVYSDLMDLIVKLAKYGLIHGDFNEFNLLVTESSEIILIDFPQMVSTCHKNAEMYFNRDVDCIRTFFKKKFNYTAMVYPKFGLDAKKEFDLDVQVAASGFSVSMRNEFDKLKEILDTESSEEFDVDTEEFGEECDLDAESSEDLDKNAESFEKFDVDSESSEVDSENYENNNKEESDHENDKEKENWDESDSDGGLDEQLESVAINENKTIKPFRDFNDQAPSFRTEAKKELKKSEFKQMTKEEIKQRVSKSLEKGSRNQKNSHRNLTKSRLKQKISVDSGIWG